MSDNLALCPKCLDATLPGVELSDAEISAMAVSRSSPLSSNLTFHFTSGSLSVLGVGGSLPCSNTHYVQHVPRLFVSLFFLFFFFSNSAPPMHAADFLSSEKPGASLPMDLLKDGAVRAQLFDGAPPAAQGISIFDHAHQYQQAATSFRIGNKPRTGASTGNNPNLGLAMAALREK
jgi:hypothetical protein